VGSIAWYRRWEDGQLGGGIERRRFLEVSALTRADFSLSLEMTIGLGCHMRRRLIEDVVPQVAPGRVHRFDQGHLLLAALALDLFLARDCRRGI
jgi:hypothetical protein